MQATVSTAPSKNSIKLFHRRLPPGDGGFLRLPFSSMTPPVKRGNRSARRRSDFLNKKYNSLNYGQSKAEAIKIVWHYISLLRRKRTSMGSSYSSISSQPTA